MKTLVTYFSASGVTEEIAKMIANEIEGDYFEIEPVDIYTEQDLDWTSKQSRSTLEMQDKNSRPKVKNKVENLDDYERVLIGYPIWWDSAPTIVNTFIEENPLDGKEIYCFCTSGGSSVEKSVERLKETYPNLNIISGKRFYGNEQKEQILEWLS